ncbi:hypothetical protein GCM10027048_28190 [Hymenobacter coalescens]
METTPGKRIQQWREYKGLTLAQMSRDSGVKVTTISTAEQPGASNPSYDTLSKLILAYPDLNPDWLLTGNGSMLRDGRELTPAPKPDAHPEVAHPSPTTVTMLPVSTASAVDVMMLLEAERRRAERAEAEAARAWDYADRERRRADVLQNEVIHKVNLYLFPHDEDSPEPAPQQPESAPAGKADADSLAAGMNPNTGKAYVSLPPRTAEGNVMLFSECVVLQHPAQRSAHSLSIGVDYSDSDAA